MSDGAKHYIPRPDGDFDAWAKNFKAAWAALGPAYGVTPAQLGAMNHKVTDWQGAYAAHIAAQAQARAAAASKDEVRAALEPLIRAMARRVQADANATDAARATMGLTTPGTSAAPGGPPTTRPTASVQIPARLTHVLRLSDESTPTKKALPRGVAAAEVYMALAPAGDPPPAAESAYQFIGLATRGELARSFPAADAGKTAHYQLRWMSTRGERGPWSDVASATVAA